MTFVETSPQVLRETVFLDGRTTFWRGEPTSVALADAAAWTDVQGDREPDRFIFHVSFCGSTLLAGLLDAAAALVLKEPHALVDLTDWEAKERRSGTRDPDLDVALALACDLLKGSRRDASPVVIKPSNWVNALLPRLIARRSTLRPLFLTLDREAFLIAVFRGGRDRLIFTARIGALLADVIPNGQEAMRKADAGAVDPLGKVANLAILAHAFQNILFERAMTAGGWGREHWMDMADLTADPAAALRRACRVLDLPTTDDAVACAVSARMGIHAKQPEAVFSTALRTRENGEVRAVHGAILDAALAWARRTIDRA